MGIRVHKVLGYGLESVEHDNGRITDPRINASSWAVYGEEGMPPVARYLEWLEHHSVARISMDRMMHSEAGKPGYKDLYKCVVWEPEAGAPPALVIRPWSQPSWYRFDDTIDYTVETWLRGMPPKPVENRVERVRGALYPWLGYMDSRTGRDLGNKVMWWVREANSDCQPSREMLDMLAQDAGLSGHEEAAQFVVPIVPAEVRDLATFAGLFTGPDIWLQLRPMLYTYWA